MDASRIQLISRKLIKPSSPTPPPLRQHKLSIIDQFCGSWYMPMAFFYPDQVMKKNPCESQQIPTLLESSLSRILTSYYPLAGRLHNDLVTIDCNDMGATLVQVHVNCEMSEILQQYDCDSVNALEDGVIYSKGLAWSQPKNLEDSLLVAQLTRFDCGGMALSVCMSHRFGDAQTLCYFICDWASIARNSESPPPPAASPKLNGAATILPPIEDPFEGPFFLRNKSVITKRYVFEHSKLSELKAKVVADTGIQDPTRVEVASALLHKCTITANDSAMVKPPVVLQCVNLRSYLNPPLSPNHAGNFVFSFNVPITSSKDLSISGVVSDMRRSKNQFMEKYKGITAKEFRQEYLNQVEHVRKITTGQSPFEMYASSSLCRLPIYHIDFGWGKPERVILASTPVKNFHTLLDDQNGDGLEALVSLDEQVVSIFESDPDLLQFASFGSKC